MAVWVPWLWIWQSWYWLIYSDLFFVVSAMLRSNIWLVGYLLSLHRCSCWCRRYRRDLWLQSKPLLVRKEKCLMIPTNDNHGRTCLCISCKASKIKSNWAFIQAASQETSPGAPANSHSKMVGARCKGGSGVHLSCKGFQNMVSWMVMAWLCPSWTESCCENVSKQARVTAAQARKGTCHIQWRIARWWYWASQFYHHG